MAEKVYLLPAALRQEFLNYLADRPFKEVAGGIQTLSQLAEHTPTEPVSRVRYVHESATDHQLRNGLGSAIRNAGPLQLVWVPESDLRHLGVDRSPGA